MVAEIDRISGTNDFNGIQVLDGSTSSVDIQVGGQVGEVITINLVDMTATGLGLNGASFPISPNPRSFFWGGWGGSLAIIDLDARATISYVMNHMEADLLGDRRGGSIAAAAYGALAAG